jgi:hypothetical protein
VNSTRTATYAPTPRSKLGNTHSASKQELATQAKHSGHASTVYQPRPTPPAPANTPNTPRHFSSSRPPPTFQQGGYQRQTTPSGNHYGDRARSQTPHTVAEIDYHEEEEDYVDAQEEHNPEVETEAIAHAVHKEMNRAKDAA